MLQVQKFSGWIDSRLYFGFISPNLLNNYFIGFNLMDLSVDQVLTGEYELHDFKDQKKILNLSEQKAIGFVIID
jgi:hypothetical protein